jgi:hypothetical protein
VKPTDFVNVVAARQVQQPRLGKKQMGDNAGTQPARRNRIPHPFALQGSALKIDLLLMDRITKYVLKGNLVSRTLIVARSAVVSLLPLKKLFPHL